MSKPSLENINKLVDGLDKGLEKFKDFHLDNPDQPDPLQVLNMSCGY